MKVLLISPQPPPYGGIANWSAMMLDYVKNTDDLFSTINIAPKKRSTEGRNLFDRVVVSGVNMLTKNRQLKKKIKYNRPDVIHMTTSGQLAIIRDIMLMKTAKKHGIKTVYHIHFGKTPEMAEKNTKMWFLFKKAMLLAGTVVAIDKKTYDTIKKYVPEANAAMAPNPIDISKLPKCAENCKKQVVFLGWVVPTKGVAELVEAWNTVGKEYPDYELLVIGQSKPEYLGLLKKKVEVQNIVFTGEMCHEKAMQTLAESEVFILPSYTEGFPYAILEAMSLGKAVIASNVGAIPQMLDGECGILVEPQDIDSVISALRAVLSDDELKNRISVNAAIKVDSEYKIEKVYEQYRQFWKGCAI